MFKIGSCRIDSQPYLFNHVHNTKQILITLNYLLKNENRELYDNIHMKPLSMNVINIIRNKLINSKKVIIEISSLKVWTDLNNMEIHWGKTKTIPNNINVISKEDFLNDLKSIIKLLKDKKVILVSHINIDKNNYNEEIECNGSTRWISNHFNDKNERKNTNDKIVIKVTTASSKKIKNRDLIEKYIDEFIINKNIHHFKPYDYIKNNYVKDIESFFEKNNNSIDTNHYSLFGKTKIFTYLNQL
tara:strand:+ start:319 stop:1050 length:732 start_codon:yes stop_codon:yes gene_type:complete